MGRNGSLFASLHLALADCQIALLEAHLRPRKLLEFRIAKTSIQGQHRRRVDVWRSRLPGFPLLSARSQNDGGKVLRGAAQAYKVDTDAGAHLRPAIHVG